MILTTLPFFSSLVSLFTKETKQLTNNSRHQVDVANQLVSIFLDKFHKPSSFCSLNNSTVDNAYFPTPPNPSSSELNFFLHHKSVSGTGGTNEKNGTDEKMDDLKLISSVNKLCKFHHGKSYEQDAYTFEEIKFVIIESIINVAYCHFFTGVPKILEKKKKEILIYYQNLLYSIFQQPAWLQCLSNVSYNGKEDYEKRYNLLFFRLTVITEQNCNVQELLWTSPIVKISIDYFVNSFLTINEELSNPRKKFHQIGSLLKYDLGEYSKKTVSHIARYVDPFICILNEEKYIARYQITSSCRDLYNEGRNYYYQVQNQKRLELFNFLNSPTRLSSGKYQLPDINNIISSYCFYQQ